MRIAKLARVATIAAALATVPAMAEGTIIVSDAATVVTSAVSLATFRLDTREGPFESTGTETITYSSLWHGTPDSTVTIRTTQPNEETIAQGLVGESNYVWHAVANGTNVLVHMTTQSSAEPETATFVVTLFPPPSATLRWKYAKNANGWFCAQVALTWHPGYAAGITNMRLLFADRTDAKGRLTAYLVDPATVVDPLGNTEEIAGTTFRAVPIELSGFANLAEGHRAVYGVKDATMGSSLASVPKEERKICLRVTNRQIQTVEAVDNKIAWLAWDEAAGPRVLPLVGGWASSETDSDYAQASVEGDVRPLGSSVQFSTFSIRNSPSPRPLSVAEANLAESFGLPLAAVAVAEVACQISSMTYGSDGSVEGTFEIAAVDAGRVVAESGELSAGAELSVLGATSLDGAFEPLDPVACGVELLSRKPPYAFRVKAPGANAFFKIRLEAEDVFE